MIRRYDENLIIRQPRRSAQIPETTKHKDELVPAKRALTRYHGHYHDCPVPIRVCLVDGKVPPADCAANSARSAAAFVH